MLRADKIGEIDSILRLQIYDFYLNARILCFLGDLAVLFLFLRGL